MYLDEKPKTESNFQVGNFALDQFICMRHVFFDAGVYMDMPFLTSSMDRGPSCSDFSHKTPQFCVTWGT